MHARPSPGATDQLAGPPPALGKILRPSRLDTDTPVVQGTLRQRMGSGLPGESTPVPSVRTQRSVRSALTVWNTYASVRRPASAAGRRLESREGRGAVALRPLDVPDGVLWSCLRSRTDSRRRRPSGDQAGYAYVANAPPTTSRPTPSTPRPGHSPPSARPFAAGTNPVSVTVDPSGKFAYVTNITSNNVSAYTINAATGALTAVGGLAVRCRDRSRLRHRRPLRQVRLRGESKPPTTSRPTPSTPATGALTPDRRAAVHSAGTNPLSVTVDPSGKFAYVANYGSNDVSAYIIIQHRGA